MASAVNARFFFLAILLLLIPACCMGDSVCKIENKMRLMSEEQANAYFKRLSNKDQVDLYVYELNVSRPVSSRYGFLLWNGSGDTAKLLADAASTTESYMVSVSILSTLEKMPDSSRKSVKQEALKSAIANCKNLAPTYDDDFCAQYERALIESADHSFRL